MFDYIPFLVFTHTHTTGMTHFHRLELSHALQILTVSETHPVVWICDRIVRVGRRRIMRLSCEPSGARESPTDLAVRLWWGLCVGRPQMFRIPAFHVGSYELDSVLQYSERFWSNVANIWCGGETTTTSTGIYATLLSRRVSRRLCDSPFSRVPYIFTGCDKYIVR